MDEFRERTSAPLMNRRVMNEQFSQGKWRPLPRHAVQQGAKWRPNDDGERSGTNALTIVGEAIVCIAPGFALILARFLTRRLHRQCGELPPWLLPIMCLEDWWKGYRQLFPSREHSGLAVVAVRDPVRASSCAASWRSYILASAHR